MYAIRWCTGGEVCDAVCPRSEEVWEIYWALKKLVEGFCVGIGEDCWIQIYSNGVACNPKKGSAMLPCKEGEGPIFILKKGTG